MDTVRKYAKLESLLGYAFHSYTLLEEALTHPSIQIQAATKKHNQRLEFLGDSILGAVLSSWLCQQFPDQDEGKLSQKKALLASGRHLAEIARGIKLDSFLNAARSERDEDGGLRDSALGDALEAIIGAVFLDGGYDSAVKLILKWEKTFLQTITSDHGIFNPKGRIQEFVQSKFQGTRISYKLVKQTGPDHRRQFQIDLYLNSEKISSGSGLSKKAAEEMAATEALKKLDPVSKN